MSEVKVIYGVLACNISLTSGHFFPLACQDQTCVIKTLLYACVSVVNVGRAGRAR